MTLLLSLAEIDATDVARYGGKACSLSTLHAAGVPIPEAYVLPGSVYRSFVAETGLTETIRFELGRKPLEEMRWEEMWDSALRLRNRFLAANWRQEFEGRLAEELTTLFADRPLAVRSSAPGEDSSSHSFAGLHDSLLGVRGVPNVLQAIRQVWASLWSDRALLYRRELGLDPQLSCMAVVLMELQPARAAGILFSRSPVSPGLGVIEAVHGQGQGLVDGSVAPDRWLLDRQSGRQVEHQPPAERMQSVLQKGRIVPTLLANDRPPLDQGEVDALWRLGSELEEYCGEPVDCEWCLVENRLLLLQTRPITANEDDPDDKRPWYLSLHPSRASLERLRSKIEGEHLPAMEQEAAVLAAKHLEKFTTEELVREIEERQRILARWEAIYQQEYIPMAHGIRLFGEAYNDRLKPADPFEFTRLLAGGNLRALQRNRALQQLAEKIKKDAAAVESLRNSGLPPMHGEIGLLWQQFVSEHGDPAWFAGEHALAALVLALTEATSPGGPVGSDEQLEDFFLQSFPDEQRADALALLDLGRAAYRLRDDDNIAFGRFLSELERARQAAQNSLGDRTLSDDERQLLEVALAGVSENELRGKPAAETDKGPLAARQLVGQPAGPGTAVGPARVIRRPEDLNAFQQGEILVCDAVDPTMTFVAPLAAAVVERRGGMLIHGAIISREYGLPCVTGVARVTELVQTGQMLTVDGWLGLVILETERES